METRIKLCLAFLLCLWSFNIWADDPYIDVSISISDAEKKQDTQNNWNTYIGAKATFTLELKNETRSIKSATGKYSIEAAGISEKSLDITVKNGKITISPIKDVALSAVKDYKLEYTITYKFTDNNIPDTTVTNGENDPLIHVWNALDVEQVGETERDIFVDISTNLSVNASGGNPDGWSYSWKIDETEKGRAKTYTYKPDDVGSVTVTVDIKNLAPDNATELYNNQYSYTITAWPVPKITSPLEETTYRVSYVGKEETMEITTADGYTGSHSGWGWTYKWYEGNNNIPLSEETSYTLQMPNATKKTYKVVATNICDEDSRPFTRIFVYDIYNEDVDITSSCKGEDIDACYANDEVTLTAVPKGNNVDEATWDYKWSDGTTSEEGKVVKYNPTKTTTYTLTATVTRQGSSGSSGYERELLPKTKTITVYAKPSITTGSLNPSDFYHGQTIPLESTPNYGNPNGWIYSWKDENSNIVGTTQNVNPKAENTNETDSIHKSYTLTASNHIGNNNYGMEDHACEPINVTVWPAPKLPTSTIDFKYSDGGKSLIDYKVREGDTFTYTIDKASGGYYDTWKYNWFVDGSENPDGKDLSAPGSFTQTAFLRTSGQTMATDSHNYSVNIHQVGPNSVTWADKNYSVNVEVYRRPQMPANLLRKGNGTTHTLIVMIGNEDESTMLNDRKYTYRFGYDDSNGKSSEPSEAVNRRWFVIKDSDFQKADKVWAIAEWKYPDGETVTSGRRYLGTNNIIGDADDKYNASSFYLRANTNGAPMLAPFVEVDVSGIEDVGMDKNLIFANGKVSATFDSPTDVTINIYDVKGQQLRSVTLPGQTQINETVDTSGLSKGLYFIEMRTSNSREIQKIIIR